MYEVYALKYSERDTTKCQFFYRESSHDKLTLHYFVWLVLGGPQPVLVDTGFLGDEAQKREMRNYVTPASILRTFGSASSPISTTTTGPVIASSRARSSGSRRKKSRSGPGPTRGHQPTAALP